MERLREDCKKYFPDIEMEFKYFGVFAEKGWWIQEDREEMPISSMTTNHQKACYERLQGKAYLEGSGLYVQSQSEDVQAYYKKCLKMKTAEFKRALLS